MRGPRHACAAVLLAVLAGASAAPGLAAEQRIALVIGNSAYADSPLTNPVNDARLMGAALREQGFEVIERLDVDRVAMKLAVRDYGNRLKAAQDEAAGLVVEVMVAWEDAAALDRLLARIEGDG